ncbi:30S ribosomal protein S6 [Candidatus Phytoplasma pini]|uniref:Small ribosomal subunit protein bS6 n=1 Tax=Candidatus Phytoplasma pini TaxID=267362 RepID=A0A559KJD3_9MOLU|nr:30S ribosomal protein S6 [Candidatus Phytoplasma pini]TVY12219.1 30S ribosomal protein S6 [Candidatus Phytoplasma pini]
MKKYEIMYILSPRLDTKDIQNITDNIKNIFKEGKIFQFKEPELKTLAYPIKKHLKGFYIEILVEADNEMIANFYHILKVKKEDIIRSIVLNTIEERNKKIKENN